ncbi:L-threonylcarbamoyladenylate synthase [Roseomonas elaeocarpi]|uniref:Threonylcarbamoyl-AMP synthase n=1 Tax=Roseomonas elaeocarpi TaxID=907779 RepID=A0ABV6JSR9_9PROT
MKARATERLPAEAVERAAALLRAGRLVAFPTETVYGLGADARDGAAVAAVFAAKGRPSFNPLIAHFHAAEAAFREVVADGRARQLAARFWPGPLTLVLPRHAASRIDPLTTAGADTVAVRVPSHPLAQRLLRAVDGPVAAPSANRSGAVSPTTAAHVLEGLDGRVDAVIDGGACAVGVESTVLDLSGPVAVLLRPGGVAAEAIEREIGPLAHPPGTGHAAPSGGAPLPSPGMLLSHYAPTLPVRLDAVSVAADEALLAFGPPLAGAGACWNLSEAGDTTEAASRLFSGLRHLDSEGRRLGLRRIAAMPVPERGLGAAVNDRLRRAAAPRD